jgi:hypothetical protein
MRAAVASVIDANVGKLRLWLDATAKPVPSRAAELLTQLAQNRGWR